jgi:putative phosphoribosyl transferase
MSQDLDFSSYFKDSADASSQLIDILPQSRMQDDDWLIIATKLSAIPLANMISLKLNLNYDILFNEPIISPNNKECEIAIVSEIEEIVIDEALVNSFEINLDYIYGQARRLHEEKIMPKVYKFRKGELNNSLKDRNILFVDFGCETGFNIISCIKSAIKTGVKSVMYATPIMAKDVYESLELLTDEIFCVKKIENYVNVDFYYKKMQKVSQDDIIEILNNAKGYLPFVKNRSDDGV